jgi:hypothetical protein
MEHLAGRVVAVLRVAVARDAQDHVGAIFGRVEISELGRGDLDVGVLGQPDVAIVAQGLRQQHGRQPRALAKQQHQGFVQGGRHFERHATPCL